MKSFVLLTLITLSASASADHWNSLLRECRGGNKSQFAGINVIEKGFRWGQWLARPALEVTGDVQPGSYATVELSVRYRDGRAQTFSNCDFQVIEDYDATFITVNDCSRSGRTNSPSITCYSGDLDDGPTPAPQVNNSARGTTEGRGESSGPRSRGAGASQE